MGEGVCGFCIGFGSLVLSRGFFSSFVVCVCIRRCECDVVLCRYFVWVCIVVWCCLYFDYACGIGGWLSWFIF